jgi:hypothetical protein
MINTKQWVDLLSDQYNLVLNSENGLDLLLSVRKFIAFLDDDPHALGYIKDLDYRWDVANEKRRANFKDIRNQLFELEQKIKEAGREIEEFVKNLPAISEAAKHHIHILERIREDNWYQLWVDTKDDLDLDLLHIEEPPQTQTGFMAASAVLSKAKALGNLTKNLEVVQETYLELENQAEKLWRQYKSVRRRLKYDWMSSGKHALEQLRIVAQIIDGELFIEPANYKFPKSKPLEPWMLLMAEFSPPDLRHEFERELKQSKSDNKDWEQTVESLIRLHLRRIFEDLQSLANTRLAHQHLVEHYKVRCENYDWKYITELIENHAKSVEEKGKARYEFEDLLTLHFARYLHDNGYKVHYTLRDGVHEPDLLGDDLEPIVVEAKVVGQNFGKPQRDSWIFEGLRALLAYLQKYYSDYGVTEGYLVVFRVGGEKFPMYMFDPDEWKIGQFTIVPKIINIGKINKKDAPIPIKQEDFIKDSENL